MHIPSIGALAVLSSLLVLPTGSTAAAAVECQGKPATIVVDVARDGGTVRGTPGDDVIVITGSGGDAGLISVHALEGNDTICVQGALPNDTGPEDDESDVDGGPGIDAFEYIGSDQDDFLEVFNTEILDIRMAGGVDRLELSNVTGTGAVKGGGRRNNLTLTSQSKIVVNLKDKVLKVESTGDYRITGFDRVSASATHVRLTGDAAANQLKARGCRATLRGGQGNDLLGAEAKPAPGCGAPGARQFGQQGHDLLRGTRKDDVLLGGPGRDTAIGKKGNDRCVAERRSGCER